MKKYGRSKKIKMSNILTIILIVVLIFLAKTKISMISIKYLSRESNIEVLDEGILKVSEISKLYIPDETIDIFNNSYNIEVKNIKENALFNKEKYKMNIVSVYLDGRRLDTKQTIENNKYYTYDNINNKINICSAEPMYGEHTIKFEYKCYTEELIDEYDNAALIKIVHDKRYKNDNIKLIIPNSTDKFKVSAIIKNIEKIDDKTYTINLKKSYNLLNGKYVNIEMKPGIIEKVNNLQGSYKNTTQIIIIYLLSLSGIIFIIAEIITKKDRRKSGYYIRDTKEVDVPPALAESIIDRKIGAKELIMSTVVELIDKGNINRISDTKIQLVNTEGLTEFKKKILDLLFLPNENIADFEVINERIKESDNQNSIIYNKIGKIKREIQKDLVSYGIYSKWGEFFIGVLKYICYILCLYIITSVFMVISPMLIFKFRLIMSIIFIVMIYKKYSFLDMMSNILSYRLFNIGYKMFITMNMQFILFSIVFYVGSLIYSGNLFFSFVLVIIFLINCINLKILKEAHIFSSNGKEVYKKVKGLRDYIVDYSLMEEKEMDSVIVWNEYLAYAVAFGIPNKITKLFDEKLMNFNNTLKTIDNIMLRN